MPKRSTQAHSLERLSRRLDHHLAELAAAEPGWLSRIRQQAHEQALQSLGLAPLQTELNAVTVQQREVRRQARALRRVMLATVRRVPIDTLGAYRGHRPHPDVRQALEQRRAVHEAQLLACEARGQELLRLRRERAGLADALWPAGRRLCRPRRCGRSQPLGNTKAASRWDCHKSLPPAGHNP